MNKESENEDLMGSVKTGVEEIKEDYDNETARRDSCTYRSKISGKNDDEELMVEESLALDKAILIEEL